MPASASARSSSLPAGPTNGWPLRSSSLPGCSPTNISSAFFAPSPNTVWVPRRQRSQAWQSLAAARTLSIVGRSGISSAALSVGVRGTLGILARDRDVPSQALCLGAPHRAAAQRRRQLIVCPSGEREEIDAVPCRARLPRGFGGARRGRVPRADLLADVAAVDVRSDTA